MHRNLLNPDPGVIVLSVCVDNFKSYPKERFVSALEYPHERDIAPVVLIFK